MAYVIAIVVAVGVVGVVMIVKPPPVAEWARSRSLVLTAGNRPFVQRYLRSAQLLRTSGVVVGLVLSYAVVDALGLRTRPPGSLLWPILGYVLGTIAAEVTRPRLDGTRATLSPRELPTYVSRRRITLARVLGLATAGVALLAYVVEPRETIGILTRPWIVAVGLAALAAPVLLECIERWIIHRPQPISSPSLLAADDAMRSQSVHSISGAGIALQITLLAELLIVLASSDVDLLRRWTTVPAMLASWVAPFAWLWFANRRWAVRRPDDATNPGASC